jgi:hypothetical protein
MASLPRQNLEKYPCPPMAKQPDFGVMLGRDKRVLSRVRNCSLATARAPNDLGADRAELLKIVAKHLERR